MKHAENGNATPWITTLICIAAVFAAGCGAASSAASSPKPAQATASPTTATTPTPTALTLAYRANLTFTGGLSGTVTAAQAPPGASSNKCGDGGIDASITLGGQVLSLGASSSSYHGPGQYRAGSEAEVLVSTPSYDIWISTGGTVTYTSGTAMTLDIDITNGMVGAGAPGSTAHIVGSLSCA